MAYEAAGDVACAKPVQGGTSFGARLRAARLGAGFATARQFALEIGLAENRYTRYERDETEPALVKIAHICRALAITPDRLMGFAVVEPSSPDPAHQPANDAMTFPPGLAEPHTPPLSATNGGAGEDERLSAGRRRWLSWQLARECADNEPAAADADSSIGVLRRTCDLFRQIERDPFGFIAGTVECRAVDDLPPARQHSLAVAIDTLCRELATRPASMP